MKLIYPKTVQKKQVSVTIIILCDRHKGQF